MFVKKISERELRQTTVGKKKREPKEESRTVGEFAMDCLTTLVGHLHSLKE